MRLTASGRWRTHLVGVGVGIAVWLVALTLAGCGDVHGAITPAAAPADGQRATGVSFDTAGWSTNFARHSVPLSTIASGGPGRDGIRPLDHPRFVSLEAAAGFLGPGEPVIAVVIAGRARAYPLQILVWHEIVNDTLSGEPVAVTYCPLCNTAIVYSRRVAGRLVTFGTTGNLRNSDLVMWDRQTQSWWQQYDGHAIVGSLTGHMVAAVPSQTLSFADFRARYPHGEVLSRHTGFDRPYGQNPYVGYDATDQRPLLYKGRLDPRLAPLQRVETITAGADTVVLPFTSLRQHAATDLAVGGIPAVVNFAGHVTSALDARQLRASREVGTAAAFDRRLGGRTLSFRSSAPGILADLQTGSRWDITGRAVSGTLHGEQLHRLRDKQAFWFAVAAFVPHARLVKP